MREQILKPDWARLLDAKRAYLQMTQGALLQELSAYGIDVGSSTLGKILSGDNSVKLETILAVARFLKVDIELPKEEVV